MNNKTAAKVLVKRGYADSFDMFYGGTITKEKGELVSGEIGHYPVLNHGVLPEFTTSETVDYHNNPDQMWALADWFDIESRKKYARSGYGLSHFSFAIGNTRTEALLKCIDKCLEDYKDE